MHSDQDRNFELAFPQPVGQTRYSNDKNYSIASLVWWNGRANVEKYDMKLDMSIFSVT